MNRTTRALLVVVVFLWLVWVWLLLAPAAAHGAAMKRPVIPKLKKRLVAPTTHGATLLPFHTPAPVAPPAPRVYVLTLKFPTNAVARFGWELQGSSNLISWFTIQYPVTTDTFSVVADQPQMFFRSKGHN